MIFHEKRAFTTAIYLNVRNNKVKKLEVKEMIFISLLTLFCIGIFVGVAFSGVPKVGEWAMRKAVQKYFIVKANEYSLEADYDNPGWFIVTTSDGQYQIKFSDLKPIQVVQSYKLSSIIEGEEA